MATEIERKFLLVNNDWRKEITRQVLMRQGYLSGTEKASVRVRVAGDKASLNIKSATLNITRKEFEVDLPVDDAHEMLNLLCEQPLIEKTRYYVPNGLHTWEIDVFSGDNDGLVVAEIELQDEQEPFNKPAWLGKEVSDDPRYYNVCLVKHPFCDW